MPFAIRKLRGQDKYKVFNKDTGAVHSKATSLANARKQVRLLYMVERKKMEGGSCCGMCMGEGCGSCEDYMSGEDDKEINGEGLPAGELKELLKRSYDKKPSSFGDYKLDTELSGQRAQVYWNEKMGKAIVVHRGTKGVQDMFTDVRYTLGDKSSKRFKHAKDIQNKANAKYGKENVITAGHSLGSVLGETAVKGKDQELITLNKPVGLADIGKTISKKQTDIKTTRDPVSILRGTQKGNAPVVLKSKTYNPLAEHSTETLGRVEENKIIGEGVKNNLHSMYMPKLSSDSQFVYIPQVRQQIFGEGFGKVQYGPHTGVMKQVHLKGYGLYGSGIQAPPSRLPIGSPLK